MVFSIIQMIPYILTNSIKTAINICIGIMKDAQSHRLQVRIPYLVGFLSFCLIVLRTIQFNNKFPFCDIEINYIRSYYLLAVNHHRQFFQKIIPQMAFFLGHISAKCFGNMIQLWIMIRIHYDSWVLLGNRLASVWGRKQAATKESI